MSGETEQIPVTPSKTPLTKAERKARRQKRLENGKMNAAAIRVKVADRDRALSALIRNEGELLEFIVQVNKLYQDKLKKPAPFMTFVLIGMQSSGKSTFMERLLNAVLNVVKENTGTRCPLDVTCIHDESCQEPRCDLFGEELVLEGNGLSVQAVFERITSHNTKLANEDRFSTKPLTLVYRANNVQNMRFVDTPGIISNRSVGKDNREDIKMILRAEMAKPNTRLCVLLEATEFAKNPIVDFLDQSLGGKGWRHEATFLMTKFDKQMGDSRTASKANSFFSEFLDNGIVPHLVITPTLMKENLSTMNLFKARNKLLDESSEYERGMFRTWLKCHEEFRQADGSNEFLDRGIAKRIGFSTAQATMRKEMLEHTLATLPTVIGSLQNDLVERQMELQALKEQQKFTNPDELKVVLRAMLICIQERVTAYLDGDLPSSLKYSDKLQTLEEEIDEEEDDSCWTAGKELNFYSEKEETWRSHIGNMQEVPNEINPEKKFLGGKQVHRAIEFFRCVMIDSLPDPDELANLVPNAVGYGGRGLMRENWEGATKQICTVLMQDLTHPGVNYLVKHIGCILRRLFLLAMEDIKEGHELSKTFRLVPTAVESHVVSEFDSMLWDLMKAAADKIHTSLEPLYSTIDPNLPNFIVADKKDEGSAEKQAEGAVKGMKKRLLALWSGSREAKEYLKRENKVRAESKKPFLQDERTSMITDEETKMILDRSFQYLVALMEFSNSWFRLQFNHFLYESFKTQMRMSFIHKASEANWEELVQSDPEVEGRIADLEDQIEGLKASLQEVRRMSPRL